MVSERKLSFLGFCLISLIFVITNGVAVVFAGGDHQQMGSFEIVGNLVDQQGEPVDEAHIEAIANHDGADAIVSEGESHEDGSWVLIIDEIPESLSITIDRPHFKARSYNVAGGELKSLYENRAIIIPEIVLDRKIDASFFVATGIFFLVLILIAFEVMHNTTASLTAMSLVFMISSVGGAFLPDLYIFSLEKALTYINWEVIFLVLGMMIIIAVIERTGLFQWTAFHAYRLSGGRSWLLVLILMAVTAIASALLDNFTTMLLMTPISLQIGLALGINPIALIIPEIMASNVGGIST